MDENKLKIIYIIMNWNEFKLINQRKKSLNHNLKINCNLYVFSQKKKKERK